MREVTNWFDIIYISIHLFDIYIYIYKYVYIYEVKLGAAQITGFTDLRIVYLRIGWVPTEPAMRDLTGYIALNHLASNSEGSPPREAGSPPAQQKWQAATEATDEQRILQHNRQRRDNMYTLLNYFMLTIA